MGLALIGSVVLFKLVSNSTIGLIGYKEISIIYKASIKNSQVYSKANKGTIEG